MRAGGSRPPRPAPAAAAVNRELTLDDRVYACSACGLVIDRDVNAAINLARYTPPRTDSPPLPAAARHTLRVRARMDRDVEPTATPHHEGPLGRNRDATCHLGVAGARTATKNHDPGMGWWSREAGGSPNRDTPS
ncbi:MAG: zinc ribbon domain-containing protein [Nocardioides sp.]